MCLCVCTCASSVSAAVCIDFLCYIVSVQSSSCLYVVIVSRSLCIKWRRWFFWPRGNNCCKLSCPCVQTLLLSLSVSSLFHSILWHCSLLILSSIPIPSSPLPFPLCVPLPDCYSVECPLRLFIDAGAEVQSCSHPSSPQQLAVRKHNFFQPHRSHGHFW